MGMTRVRTTRQRHCESGCKGSSKALPPAVQAGGGEITGVHTRMSTDWMGWDEAGDGRTHFLP